jgi:hypothetical protein
VIIFETHKYIEDISSEGGLNNQVEEIIKMSKEQELLVVFAMNRKKLGAAIGSNIFRLSLPSLSLLSPSPFI